MVFEHEYKVRMEDVDRDNLLSNKALLGIFEDIACLHAASLGQGPKEVTENGFAWILLNWKMKILKRSAYGDVIFVKTWPREFDKICSHRDFEVTNEAGEIVALGSSRWFVMDVESRRPKKLTEEYTNTYLPITSRSVFGEDLNKLNVPEEYSLKTSYEVSRRDIDSNKHMHNINYLTLAYDALPEDVFENNNFDNVAIEYKKELMYKEKVDCYYSYENGEHVVTIKTEDKVNAVVVLS